MPKLYNLNRDNVPGNAVLIDRSTPYGNPFQIGVDGTRKEVCEKFEREVLPNLDLEPLRGKDLVCHCKPKQCHGDSILAALYEPNLDKFFG